ncbi:Ig-like domain-containing protein, partial [Novipirellula herctigrandis]|uniref:Ig-like domain-containing protein n=1 Tax=Novipirellula herctigrandis TaxID=2527986 RepID=UPI003AF3BAD3
MGNSMRWWRKHRVDADRRYKRSPRLALEPLEPRRLLTATPFNADPLLIQDGAKIQAEEYDLGGEGAAYHDSGASNGSGGFRGAEGVDLQVASDVDGGHNLGWTADGEWLRYSVDVMPGIYNITARVASQHASPGDLRLLIGDGTTFTELGVFSIESTGGSQSWNTLTIPNVSLEGGSQVLRAEIVGGNFNLNWFEFTEHADGMVVDDGIEIGYSGSSLTAQNDDVTTNEDTAVVVDVLDNDSGGVSPLSIVPEVVMVADYVDDFQNGSPPTGWQYLWNENGSFGNASNYSPLTWESWRYYPKGVTTTPYLTGTGGHSGNGSDDATSGGFDRYAIAAYTTQSDGEYSIADSLLSRSGEFGDGVEVAVHVTGGEITQLLQVSPEDPDTTALEGTGTFDTPLGFLAAGTTIYVAVGPDGLDAGSSNGNDGLSWDYSIVRIDGLRASTAGATITTDGTTVTYDARGLFDSLQASETATDTFTYRVTDGSTTDDGAVSVTITGVNDAPVAEGDLIVAYQGREKRLFVLENDHDVDDETLSLSSFSQPAHGVLVDNGDGSLRYTPTSGFVGSDSFSYTIQDAGGLQSIATVSLSVLAVEEVDVSIDVGAHRLVEGTLEFDRTRYLGFHGDQWVPEPYRSQLADPNEFNIAKTRFDTNIDGVAGGVHLPVDYPDGLPEDATNPGFIDRDLLVDAIQAYSNWVANDGRNQPLREHALLGESNENVAVYSGRNTTLHWPDYLLTDQDTGQYKENIPLNYPGYADLINLFFTELDIPIESDRLYFEVMNEPNFDFHDGYTIDNVVEMHKLVPPLIRAVHPDLLIGGPGFGGTGFRDQDGWSLFEQVMREAGDELDFWSFHPYDRYNISSSNVVAKGIVTSAGRLSANLDLIESYSNEQFGTPKQIAITEYGAWTLAFGDYSQYSRQDRMWDQVNAVMEKMLVFMDRPDRILTATPFLSTYDRGINGGASEGDKWSTRLWVKDDDGNTVETTVASMYRLLVGIDGNYAQVSSDNANLQTQAYRNGDTAYLVLNNLQDAPLNVDLTASAGTFGSIDSAVLRRLRFIDGEADFDSGNPIVDWSSLALDGQEKAVLVFTLGGSETYDSAMNERTFYGDRSNVPIADSGTATITVTTDLRDAVSAKLRIAYMRPSDGVVPEITINVNGTAFVIPGGTQGYDDADATTTSRQIDLPMSVLNDGSNAVEVTFPSAGGNLLSTVVLVQQSLGDFNDSGGFDGLDRKRLVGEVGQAVTAANIQFDLNEDNAIDSLDVGFWDTLRGTHVNSTPVGLPSIIGVAKSRGTLSVDTTGINDADGLGTLNYQWLRGSVAIPEATNTEYLLSVEDVGFPISVQVSYTDAMGTDEGPLASSPTALVLDVNEAPVLDISIADQTATEDSPFTFSFSGNTFGDPDDDALSYVASLA